HDSMTIDGSKVELRKKYDDPSQARPVFIESSIEETFPTLATTTEHPVGRFFVCGSLHLPSQNKS
ncbi:hypothetical protein GWI33_003823, partial [Rhynchophorus ferrugineus]